MCTLRLLKILRFGDRKGHFPRNRRIRVRFLSPFPFSGNLGQAGLLTSFFLKIWGKFPGRRGKPPLFLKIGYLVALGVGAVVLPRTSNA